MYRDKEFFKTVIPSNLTELEVKNLYDALSEFKYDDGHKNKVSELENKIGSLQDDIDEKEQEINILDHDLAGTKRELITVEQKLERIANIINE